MALDEPENLRRVGGEDGPALVAAIVTTAVGLR
jgi:hypothetical protein